MTVTALGLCLTGWALGNVAAAAAQRRLIFKPPRHVRVLERGPYPRSYHVEPMTLQVDATTTLEGWRSMPAGNAAPCCTLLYFGGRGENVAWAPHMSSYVAGMSVIAFNYRGYGGSTGVATEAAIHADAATLAARLVDRGSGPFIVMGRSLGTAVATRLASRVAPDRLILISPFDSIGAVMRSSGPLLWPASLLLRHRMDTRRPAGAITCPTLVIMARGDRSVPTRRSLALARRLAGPVTLHMVDGQVHRSLPRCVPVQRRIADFLADLAARPPAEPHSPESSGHEPL
jgi:pimeloyl-ACP methyl ester carboxylesterase